jgi:SnoaL-like polyketide cyclase
MSLEENKRLAREAIKILTTGDLDAADALQHHDPEDPRDLHGIEAMKTFAQEFRQAFPDFHDAIDIQLAEADLVATLHVYGDPQRCVHGRGAHQPRAYLDRDSYRPHLGGQDREELGQLGHGGHDAAAGGHLRGGAKSGLLTPRSI